MRHLPFLDYLFDKCHISLDQKNILALETQNTGQRVEQLIVQLGFVSLSKAAELYASYLNMAVYSPSEHLLSKQLITQFPIDEARSFKILPLEVEEGILKALMVDPADVKAIDRLHCYFPYHNRITPILTLEADLLELIDRAYKHVPPFSPLVESPAESTTDFNATHFAEHMLNEAVKLKASDIHLEPEENTVTIRLRIDGILKQTQNLHKLHWSALSVRLKIMSGMNIAESRLPQDGRFTAKIGGRMVDFRVATHPTLYGENIVIRVLDKLHSLRPLEDLGFNGSQVEILKAMIKQPEGIIILTGPTGSGKTTTLYSLLNYIKAQDLNIMTLEEPVEYEIKGIRQTEIKEAANITFADGIRSLLRQDPDVILVGEIRDPETAQMAVRAAMTGHLVLTTLHTNDCFGAVYRLLELGINPGLLAGNLLGIVSQRLVRKVCKQCHGHCCIHCDHSGYRGRIAIGEILAFDDDMQAIIAECRPITDLKKQAFAKSFKSLEDQALELTRLGLTNIEEMQRVVKGRLA